MEKINHQRFIASFKRSAQWTFILGLLSLTVLTGCSNTKTQGFDTSSPSNSSTSIASSTPASNANSSENSSSGVNSEQQKVDDLVTKAIPALTEGLKGTLPDPKSIVKLEGVSVVKEGNKTWLWAGERLVDYVGTGTAVLLSSENGGTTWNFVGRLQQYPASLENQLKVAKVYDIQRYLQAQPNRKDEKGIQVGDFPLSPEQAKDAIEKSKLEPWRTDAQALVKHQAAEFGFPSGTSVQPENDYFTATVQGVTYYIFTKPLNNDNPATYAIARIAK